MYYPSVDSEVAMEEKKDDDSLMHEFKETEKNSFFSMKIVGLLLAVVLLGVGSGYFLAGGGAGGSSGLRAGSDDSNGKVEKGKVYGEQDESQYKMKEVPEGVLKVGGFEGEGEFHIERGVDKSQWVYLNSTVLDLSQFVGKKVKVWGETQKAQKAGWLMDAGRVQMLE